VSDKQDLGTLLRDTLPQYRAPQSLHDWARAQARAEEAPASTHGRRVTRIGEARTSRLLLYAAGLLIAVGLGWTASAAYSTHRESVAGHDALVAELVDNHVRSLIGEHLVDIRSTDQHTVKPWFAGKADFAPRVVDLTSAGFPLLGGRVDYIHGRTAAALVYGRRRHTVNLFMWPAAKADTELESRRYNGYALLHWVDDGLSYWAVTDAAPADLETFRKLFESGN
jgi:anti-sigma factor RsiW